MKNHFLAMLCLIVCSIAHAQSTIYVSPSGSASSPGTSISSPTTLANAIATVTAGGTIYMRGGTYSYSATIVIDDANNGTSSANKNITAYAGEVPVLDFSAQAAADANRGIVLDGDNWHITGLTVTGAGDNGMLLSGNSNTIEQCIFSKNHDTGLQLSRYKTSNTTISQWPSNNLILNCEAFDNADNGNENADGFAAKLTCGTGNIFRGCISHNNIDDGWDFYAKTETGPIGTVTLENCVAYNNGQLSTGSTSGSGDKNGFKLGGSGIAVNHIVRRCVAFGNGHHGFTDNDNPGNIEVSNNTSYNNAESNFNFRTGSTATFRNNLSYNAGSSDKSNGTDVSNSNVWWKNNVSTNAGSLVVSSADFVSLTATVTKNADGSPNLGNFLALASGSDMINAGVTATGITYNGSAPDIGARESESTTVSYTLTTTASPTAGGSVSGAGSYSAGATATVTATAASGYTFTGWSGAASGTTNPISITMNANQSVTANFTATATTYTLTATASPTAGGSVSGAGSYASGATATVTATPASGYTFTGWSGAATGTTNHVSITMNANKSVTANFTATATTYTLAVTASPSAGGTVTGAGSYSSGATATITATAASGYTFTGWSGDASGTSTSTTVTMNANKAAVANFQVVSGGSSTIRIEDDATATTGLCSYEGSISSNSGANNGKVINLTNSTAKGINWKVNTPSAGSYTLTWRYVNSSTSNTYTMKLIVNGVTINSAQAFPKTSSSTTFATSTATVSLVSGGNTIRLESVASNATADIDWIEITGTGPTAGNCNVAKAGPSMVPIVMATDKAGVYPNPSKGTANVGFYLSEADNVTISVVNAEGKTVLSQSSQLLAGYHVKALNMQGKQTGFYTVVVTGKKKQRETFKLIIE